MITTKGNSKIENQFCSPIGPSCQSKNYGRIDNDKPKPMSPIGTSLTDENMMNISQSIDSLNTIGSNGTTDDLEDSRILFQTMNSEDSGILEYTRINDEPTHQRIVHGIISVCAIE